MVALNVRTYTVRTANGTKLGVFTTPNELAEGVIAHFGKGYRNLANTLAKAIAEGKNTEFIERVLGVRVVLGFAELAA